MISALVPMTWSLSAYVSSSRVKLAHPGGVAPFWASAGVIRPLARTAKAPTSARVRRRAATVVRRVETSTYSPGRGRPMMRPALWNRQSESRGLAASDALHGNIELRRQWPFRRDGDGDAWYVRRRSDTERAE